MANKEPLNGRVFVFTGEMAMSRDDARHAVVLLGARTTTGLSGKTTHLVAGSDPGQAKLAKARELGVEVIGEAEFRKILEDARGAWDEVTKTDINNASAECESKAMRAASASVSDFASEFSADGCAGDRRPWAEKYRPAQRKELVGNPSAIQQLEDFLRGKTAEKAALVSGPPGVGKTTAVLLLSRLCGVEAVEFNASDLRNKSSLAESIGRTADSGLLRSDMGLGQRVIVMDEVDGMASDRGGIPELVGIIKRSRSLVVCICNDRTHPKMRTLAGHCLDLRFRKLDSRALVPRVKQILALEGKHLGDGLIEGIVMSCGGDMRYVLNTLQAAVGQATADPAAIDAGVVRKNAMRGSFELAAELFQRGTVGHKIDVYFEDYAFLPLFVHENYIKCRFGNVGDLARAADSISFSDLLDARIHGPRQEWSLMPYHAFYSSVLPTHGRQLSARLDFPLLLGQNSKAQKASRLLADFTHHCRYKLSRADARLFVAELLATVFMSRLAAGDVAGSTGVLVETELMRDDVVNASNMVDEGLFRRVPAKNKAALARACKALKRLLPYTTSEPVAAEEEESEE